MFLRGQVLISTKRWGAKEQRGASGGAATSRIQPSHSGRSVTSCCSSFSKSWHLFPFLSDGTVLVENVRVLAYPSSPLLESCLFRTPDSDTASHCHRVSFSPFPKPRSRCKSSHDLQDGTSRFRRRQGCVRDGRSGNAASRTGFEARDPPTPLAQSFPSPLSGHLAHRLCGNLVADIDFHGSLFDLSFSPRAFPRLATEEAVISRMWRRNGG